MRPFDPAPVDSGAATASRTDPILDWLVPLLVCPACGDRLFFRPDARTPADGVLAHIQASCAEAYPVIDGIPRLLLPPHRADLVRAKTKWFEASLERLSLAERWRSGRAGPDAIVAGFDYEWMRFRYNRPIEAREIFELYFDLVPSDHFAPDRVVLDAGCGAGRWACEVAARGPRVIAVDLGLSVEIARVNAGETTRIACVQADLLNVSLAASSVDWAYSLGVLHHLRDPDRALRQVARAVRPGGTVLVYVYYALDQRGRAFRLAFRIVDAVRRVTSRLPRRAVLAISTALGLFIYWPLARLSALLMKLGWRSLADALPLSFYRERSLATMLNDSLDRFGTRLERRYTRDGLVRLLREAQLGDVVLSPNAPYWHGIGATHELIGLAASLR